MRLTKPLVAASLFALFLVFIFVSCRKTDRSDLPIFSVATATEKFFKIPATTDPLVVALSQNMLRQEVQHPYVNDFVKRAGFSRWDKAVIVHASQDAASRILSGDSELVFLLLFGYRQFNVFKIYQNSFKN